MAKVWLQWLLGGVCAGLLHLPLQAQDARVRPATRVSMPVTVDSNSPAFWRDGQLRWFGSHGQPYLNTAADQFGPWTSIETGIEPAKSWPTWMESVHAEDNGVLWGWYHTEPTGLVADSTLTAPKIGAVVSFDGGVTLEDLGILLESGDPLNPQAQNGYFAGGHGDFTVLSDRDRQYFYFFFDNYGGADETQGVCIARMAYADRFSPQGKVWKYYNGAWQEAGLGGRVSPIFGVKKPWQSAAPDALWGPSVHWNTYLNCYVMLLNHCAGEPGWSQEGVYVSFCTDLSRPESWTEPRKILDKSEFSGWYFFYPQVMGLEPGGTDRRAGQVARLYVNGISKWEIEFTPPAVAPASVQVVGAASSVSVGQAATLSVSVTGAAGPFTYQWYKDGVAIPEATAATYQFKSAAVTDAGNYAVIVSNAYGSRASNPVTLVVAAGTVDPIVVPPVRVPQAFLSNLSVRGVLGGEGDTLSVGFVLQSDQPKPLALRAVGPSLALFGVANAAVNPRVDVFDGRGVQTGGNDDWLATDADAFAAMGAFPLPVGSQDAALIVNAPSGAGTAVVNATEGGGAVLVEIYDRNPATRSKIINLSVRTVVGDGDRALIGGFAVTGTGTKRLLIRAMGPQLAAFGVTDALDNPQLTVYENGGAQIAENDDWSPELASVAASAGAVAFDEGSHDAATVITANAGSSYTVVVRSASGATGEALLEVYELP